MGHHFALHYVRRRRHGGGGSGQWKTPDSTYDSGYNWSDDSNAIDDNTSTQAHTSYNNSWLELRLTSSIQCTKVRLWADRDYGHTPEAKVDVYYDGAWHNIHDGILNDGEWTEVEIGSQQQVEKARVCAKNLSSEYFYLYEFAFWEVT